MTELKTVAPYSTHIGGKYTLAGIVQDYFDELSIRSWLENTQDRYLNDYKEKIFPGLSDRPLDEYSLKDFENRIQNIQFERVEQKCPENAYSDRTMQHYRYLIRIAVHKAAEKGILERDILWGTYFSLPGEGSDIYKELATELLKLPKSLSVSEDIQVFLQLCTDYKIPGPRMGLFLMYALGIRNGEACGATFRDIKEMVNHRGYYIIRLFQTVDGETGALKRGGKTKNMPRKLVLYGLIYSFLMKRQTWLQEMIDAGEIILEEGQKDAFDLPIACSKDSYTRFCLPGDLTNEGRQLLKEIHFSEKQLAYIDRALQNEAAQLEMVGVKEKDPTAYLLRRHLGMFLSILGFEKSEIEAWMAHKITAPDVNRNDYENEDLLYRLAKKLENRPLFNDKYPHQKWKRMNTEHPQLALDNTEACHMLLELKAGQAAHIHASAKEPGHQLVGKASSKDPQLNEHLQITRDTSFNKTPREGPANIVLSCQDYYQRTLTRLTATKKKNDK